MALHLRQEQRPEAGVAHEVEGDGAHFAVHVADKHQHGPLAEDAADAARVAALEQLAFVLEDEPVQAGVGRHDCGLAEQVHRTEDGPVACEAAGHEPADRGGRVRGEEGEGVADEGPAAPDFGREGSRRPAVGSPFQEEKEEEGDEEEEEEDEELVAIAGHGN